jgi:hypothetical protein
VKSKSVEIDVQTPLVEFFFFRTEPCTWSTLFEPVFESVHLKINTLEQNAADHMKSQSATRRALQGGGALFAAVGCGEVGSQRLSSSGLTSPTHLTAATSALSNREYHPRGIDGRAG